MSNLKSDLDARLLQSVLDAREAATELGQGVLVHIMDMALIELGADAVREFNFEQMHDLHAEHGQASN